MKNVDARGFAIVFPILHFVINGACFSPLYRDFALIAVC